MEKEATDKFDAELDAEKRKISELYREIKGGNDDGKLNWMYKNPMEVVEREEYLLGRSVDKTLDFISGKDEGASSSKDMSNMPKRLVTEANRSQKGQVELQKKVLEDPLFAIRQKEIDARKQLLSNPVKMKEIKAMLDSQAKKAKRHENRLKAKQKKRDMVERVNYLLIKRLKKLSSQIDVRTLVNSVQEESSDDDKEMYVAKKTKVDKKHTKKDASSEKHKKKVIRETDSSETNSGNKKRKKKRQRSETDESSDEKIKNIPKKQKSVSDSSSSDSENSLYDKYLNRRGNKSKRPPPSSSSETDSSSENTPSEKRSKDQRHEIVSDSEDNDEDGGRRHRTQHRKNSCGSRSRGRGLRNAVGAKDDGRFEEKRRGRGGGRGNRGRSRGYKRDINRGRYRRRPSQSGSDLDKKEGSKKERFKPSRNWRSPDRRADVENTKDVPKKYRRNRSRSADVERRESSPDRNQEKKYGLSTVDGSKPDLSPKEFIKEYSTYKKKEKKKYVAPKPIELNEEEREAQLKAMMDNAKRRKEEQATESKQYRNLKEKEDKLEAYDKDFMRSVVSKNTNEKTHV